MHLNPATQYAWLNDMFATSLPPCQNVSEPLSSWLPVSRDFLLFPNPEDHGIHSIVAWDIYQLLYGESCAVGSVTLSLQIVADIPRVLSRSRYILHQRERKQKRTRYQTSSRARQLACPYVQSVREESIWRMGCYMEARGRTRQSQPARSRSAQSISRCVSATV